MKPVSIGPHYPWSFCQPCYTEFKGGEKPKEQDQPNFIGRCIREALDIRRPTDVMKEIGPFTDPLDRIITVEMKMVDAKFNEIQSRIFDEKTDSIEKIEWIRTTNKRLRDDSKYDGWQDEERGY